MSWIQELYDTYQNCLSAADADEEVPLLPICHTTQKAQITITIDAKGGFRRAEVVSRDEARTVIPCTEESGGRTGNPTPHPLCDKLQYVAGDFLNYWTETDPVKIKKETKNKRHETYLSQLERWCSSEFADPKAAAVLCYVRKGKVIADLVENGVLWVSENKRLMKKEDVKNLTGPGAIFGVLGTQEQEDCFVRWAVEIPGSLESRIWKDASLQAHWIQYYIGTQEEKTLCYVSGDEELAAYSHPAKLRNDGDKAKLISSNDTTGYTFRGRFTDASQAAGVGYVTSQKAHSALRWLIARQGYRKGSLAVVAWAVSGAPLPRPLDDPLAALEMDDLPEGETGVETAQHLALRLRKRIAGYGQQLSATDDVIVMAVDSATTGRLSITYHRKLTGSDFLQRIDDWHRTCAWLHRYGRVKVKDERTGKSVEKFRAFLGAPAPADIAEAAYGQRVDDRLKQATVMRLLPCIIDGQPIPRDLVISTVRRACNRTGLNYWEWNKTLSIACSMYRKYNHKENYEMPLDLNRKTRDYLYGRLLALAESLEEWALSSAGERRETNCARHMQRFAAHPCSTWRNLELALIPYKARLGGKSKKRQRMIDEVVATFSESDFLSDKPLSGEFLLGYHSQREALRAHMDETVETSDEDAEIQSN